MRRRYRLQIKEGDKPRSEDLDHKGWFKRFQISGLKWSWFSLDEKHGSEVTLPERKPTVTERTTFYIRKKCKMVNETEIGLKML